MRHALGKLPSPGHDIYESFNAAGNRLFDEFNWEWLTEGPVSLPVVAGQDYLDLPRDFGQLLDVWVPNTGTFTQIEVVDRSAIAAMRAASSIASALGTLRICFNANARSRQGPSVPRALIYPTPETAGSPTLQLMYVRGWEWVGPQDNDRVPNVPANFEHCLDLCARATACLIENQVATVEEAAYQKIVNGLKEADTRQPSEGFVRGGVNSRRAMQRRTRNNDTSFGLADLGR